MYNVTCEFWMTAGVVCATGMDRWENSSSPQWTAHTAMQKLEWLSLPSNRFGHSSDPDPVIANVILYCLIASHHQLQIKNAMCFKKLWLSWVPRCSSRSWAEKAIGASWLDIFCCSRLERWWTRQGRAWGRRCAAACLGGHLCYDGAWTSLRRSRPRQLLSCSFFTSRAGATCTVLSQRYPAPCGSTQLHFILSAAPGPKARP